MKNIITASMLEEFMSLDRDEQVKVLQFCKDSESMTYEEIASIQVDKHGPQLLRTMQRKAVSRAKNTLRRRERKVAEILDKPETAKSPQRQDKPQVMMSSCTATPRFVPVEPVAFSSETIQRIEWASDIFPDEVKRALVQSIDHIIYRFRRLPANEILPAQALVHQVFSQTIEKILSPLLAGPAINRPE